MTIPLAPELVEAIKAVKLKGLTFVAQGNGQPLTKESFGNWFGEACKGAGLKGYNAHGLRKLAATRRDRARAERSVWLDGQQDGLALRGAG